MKVTNLNNVPLALAVWLLQDNYDYVHEEKYISATSLMRPIRQIILPDRIPEGERQIPDVLDNVSRALGHSLHDSLERAWLDRYSKPLELLGYPDEVISRIKVNPPDEELKADTIPIYLEQRAIREFMGYHIGGKFDMVAEGIVQDFKSTSAFTWLYGSRDDEHALQGSIYRWLNPKKITSDFIRINYIFTDWQKASAKTNPNYPQQRVLSKDIPLLSIAETERWIREKIQAIEKYGSVPEINIPFCTDDELWMSSPAYKYFADPSKVSGRSTKNFDSLQEANQFKAEKGKGVVITVPGSPKRCAYCAAFQVCSQKDRYIHA